MPTAVRFLTLVTILLCISACARTPSRSEVESATNIISTYEGIVGRVDTNRLKADVGKIAQIGSRLTGSLGERRTFALVEARLRELGLQNIRYETFQVTVPDVDSRGFLNLGSNEIELYPIWPNLVRTSTCDVQGKLLYGGQGTLEEFNRKDLKGTIVVLEFNSGTRWRNAARLGAAAVIFLEPKSSTRSEAELKFGTVPLSFPDSICRLIGLNPCLKPRLRRSKFI